MDELQHNSEILMDKLQPLSLRSSLKFFNHWRRIYPVILRSVNTFKKDK